MTSTIEIPEGAVPLPEEPQAGSSESRWAWLEACDDARKHNEPPNAECPPWCNVEEKPLDPHTFNDVLMGNPYMHVKGHAHYLGSYMSISQEEFRLACSSESTWGPLRIWIGEDAAGQVDVDKAEQVLRELRSAIVKYRQIRPVGQAHQ